MQLQPVDRDIHIFEAFADCREPHGAREKLARHIRSLEIVGERDPHRLTAHGLSFLRDFERRWNGSSV